MNISHKLIGIAMTHYIENCPRNLAASHSGLADAIAHAIRQWLSNQRLKAAIRRERAELLTMSDAMLKDIGVDRVAAHQEAGRTDIPANRNA